MVRRLRQLAIPLLVASAVAGCKDRSKDDTDEAPPPVADDGVEATPPEPPPKPSRVPGFDAPAIEAKDGFLEGGVAYAAVRVDAVIPFLQRLPIPPEAARDLAEAGSVLGMDLRVDDVATRLGLAPKAVVTMTLFRPMDDHAAEIRKELARDASVIEALARSQEVTKPEGSLIPTSIVVPPEVKPPPPSPDPLDPLAKEVDPPAPPELAPETIAKAEMLRRHSTGLGFHVRFHVQATDPHKLPSLVESQLSRGARTMYDVMCSAIPNATTCVGERDMVVIFREMDGSLLVDLVEFALDGEAESPTRVAAVREAVLAKPANLPVLSKLHGDAAVYIEAAAVARFAALDGVRDAWRTIEWSTGESRTTSVRRRLERITSLERQRDAPLLFEGMTIETTLGADEVRMRAQWVPVPEMKESAAALLVAPRPRTPAPALEALCAEAIVCGRTKGLPPLSALRDKLGTGVYAESGRDFERVFDDGREWSVATALLASWPNILGSSTRWIGQSVGSGPEAAIVSGALESAQKIETTGFVLIEGVDRTQGKPPQYIVYLRGPDATALGARGLLDLSGTASSDERLDGVAKPVRWFPLETGLGVGISIDQDTVKTDDGATPYGWIFASDDVQRFAWLAGLDTEPADTPSAYLEAPNLWSLASAFDPHLTRELSFAQTWLSQRHLRAQLLVEAGTPIITATVAK